MAPGGVELATVLVSLEDGGPSLDAGYQAVDEGDDGNSEVLATGNDGVRNMMQRWLRVRFV